MPPKKRSYGIKRRNPLTIPPRYTPAPEVPKVKHTTIIAPIDPSKEWVVRVEMVPLVLPRADKRPTKRAKIEETTPTPTNGEDKNKDSSTTSLPCDHNAEGVVRVAEVPPLPKVDRRPTKRAKVEEATPSNGEHKNSTKTSL